MTIRTEAREFDGPQTFTDVKLPGHELQLLALDIDGNQFGTITLSRVERLDSTIFTVDAGTKGKAIKEWLAVDGVEETAINPKRKRGTKTFEHANTEFSIAPRGRAVYFLDQMTNRQYRNLRVMLQAG